MKAMMTNRPHASPVRPLVLLDVDGVLNPEVRPGPGWQPHRAQSPIGTFDVILNPGHGRLLLEFADRAGADLVWATSWEHYANHEIAPRIGLPELPVIEVNAHTGAAGIHPKTPPVAEYVAGRPFVWFDDDLDPADTTFLERHGSVGHFRIIHVGPHHGLDEHHLRQAAAWLASLPSSHENRE